MAKNATLVPKKQTKGLKSSPLILQASVNAASTAKQELHICYKKIADLETRIHGLTLMTSIVSMYALNTCAHTHVHTHTHTCTYVIYAYIVHVCKLVYKIIMVGIGHQFLDTGSPRGS